jgi:tRNA G18 (ribose-2'-O)-methylase SpoU
MIDAIAVTDPADPRILQFRGVRDADLRGRDGLFCVESPRVLRRFLYALAARTRGHAHAPSVGLHAVLATREVLTELDPLLEGVLLSQPSPVAVFTGSESLMTQLAGYRMHKGALALGTRPESPGMASLLRAIGEEDDLIMPLGVVHTDNIGAVFRNAGSLGACGVLLAGGSSDPLHRKSIRISSGRVFSVPWGESESWVADLRALREEHGFALIAAEDAPESIPLDRLHECTALASHARCAIVLGAEGAGLSREARAMCDAVCAIPMRAPGGLVESGDRPSLNVAVASALLLHGVRHARSHARSARV